MPSEMLYINGIANIAMYAGIASGRNSDGQIGQRPGLCHSGEPVSVEDDRVPSDFQDRINDGDGREQGGGAFSGAHGFRGDAPFPETETGGVSGVSGSPVRDRHQCLHRLRQNHLYVFHAFYKFCSLALELGQIYFAYHCNSNISSCQSFRLMLSKFYKLFFRNGSLSIIFHFFNRSYRI